MTRKEICPACGGKHLRPFYEVRDIPVQSCVLLDTHAAALEFPCADIALSFCRECGFIFNAAFEPALVDYAAATEESQHFSGTFSRFAETLVDEIASIYDLGGKQTLEIGCGKGDFLSALVRRTGTTALGVDPGFNFDRAPEKNDAVTFQREYFRPDTIPVPPDFIVCRHTLEHVPDVERFVGDIRKVVSASDGAGTFFETPDVGRVLAEGAFWDIYYEHCSYFTPATHAGLFRRSGFEVTRLYLAYDDQYIIQYARPQPSSVQLPSPQGDLGELTVLAEASPDRLAASRAYWTEFVDSRRHQGKRIAIWGGGSKCVSFLTTNDFGDEIAAVVDVNPYKQGKFLPKTGHQVLAPEALEAAPPDTVIVMNPIYLREIGNSLAAMGLAPELVAL